MALKGCCCCGLRGGAKAVGVFFLVVTLLNLVGVIVAWALCVRVPTESRGFGVDTPGGRFGLRVSDTRSVLGGRGGKVDLNLGRFGSFSGSVSDDGRVSVHTPGGDIDSDGRRHLKVPGIEWMPLHAQVALITCTVFVLLAVMFNSMLIHGTDHDSPCAVLAWLVFYGIVFVLHTISSVGGLITALIFIRSDGIAPAAVGAGLGVLISALLWYWWALVLTFHRQLLEATRGFTYQRDVSLQEPPKPLVLGNDVSRKAEACA